MSLAFDLQKLAQTVEFGYISFPQYILIYQTLLFSNTKPENRQVMLHDHLREYEREYENCSETRSESADEIPNEITFHFHLVKMRMLVILGYSNKLNIHAYFVPYELA
jgi:hypothetical protein